MGALENNCVAVEIALLNGQSILAAAVTSEALQIVNYDSNDQAEKDRIVVTAQPRQVELYDRTGGSALIHKTQVDVEIILATRDVTALDTYIQAVEAAHRQPMYYDEALFPDGLDIRQTDDGSREGEGTNARKRTKSFLFIGNEYNPDAASEVFTEGGFALLLESGDSLLLEA